MLKVGIDCNKRLRTIDEKYTHTATQHTIEIMELEFNECGILFARSIRYVLAACCCCRCAR